MKKQFYFIIAVLLPLSALFAGCDKNPMNKLKEASTASNSSSWSGTYVVYDDELRTGGDVMMIGWGDNFTVDFNSRENPLNGVKCIKIAWDGGDVMTVNGATNLYTGLALIVAKNYADYLTTTRDLSPGGYTKVTFWAKKGFMSSNTVLRMESPNGTSTSIAPANAYETALTDDWAFYSFDITGSLANARFFVNIVLKTTGTTKGNGATIYLDDIKLAK